MVIRVTVTQKHIDKGQRFQCYKCPIALAVKAALKPIYPEIKLRVAVQAGRVFVRRKGCDKWNHVYLPELVSDWVSLYDRLWDDRVYSQAFQPKPFEFILNLGENILP